MLLRLPWYQVASMLLLLASMITPLWQTAHVKHARRLLLGVLLTTLLILVLYLLLVSNRTAELILLRSYAFCSVACCLVDEWFSSARDEEKPLHFIALGTFLLLAIGSLIFLLGGITGHF